MIHIIFTRRFIYYVIFLALSIWGLSYLGGSPDSGYFYSLIPAVMAVSLAFATHDIYISLGLSVLVGATLLHIEVLPLKTAVYTGVIHTGKTAWSALSDATNLQILWFACLVLTMVAIINDLGGFLALAQYLSRFVKSKRSSLFATYIMGMLIFIDDYASTMVTGSSMRSLADRFAVSREKLAFIVDATSAPIAGLAVISTWIGYEVGLFEQMNASLKLGVNGYVMFFDALSARFYCLFMLLFIFLNILTGLDFGPMAKAEERAEINFVGKKAFDAVDGRAVWLSILPFLLMISFLFISLWRDGGGYNLYTEVADLFSFSYWRQVISQASNNILILAKAATLGVSSAFFIGLFINRHRTIFVVNSLFSGLRKGLMPVVILILAWSLKAVSEELKAGIFLTSILSDAIRPNLFPACLFVTAAFVAISTGTSWGTMAILIPTAIPLAHSLDGGTYGLITMISLGAILDGAIMGDHCSPISDTTILTSASTECNHIAHVNTQMPYCILVGVLALVCGYLPAAYGFNWTYTTGFGVIALVFVFSAIKIFKKPKELPEFLY